MPKTHVSLGDAGLSPRGVTRRDALRLLIGAGICATFFPAVARATTTQEQLDAAQLSYEQAQEELAQIGEEYAEIAERLSQTQSQAGDARDQVSAKQEEIDQKQDEIDQKQEEIDQKQDEIAESEAEIAEKQELLGQRMSSAYKAGTTSMIDLLLSSSTFEELTSNIYYLDKVTEADRAMIDEVKSLKERLETQRSELEKQRSELEAQQAELREQRSELEERQAELETLEAQQQEELSQARAKQQESQDLVSSLSAEVQELMAQRDAELLAAQQAAQQVAQQQQQSGSSGSSGSSGGGSLSAVVSAAYSTPSPGSGLCAAWVTNVFRNAGVGSFGGNACDMYNWYCGYSTSQIQPGMIIAVPTAPYSSAAIIYGHVGIYVGNNTVRDNASGVLRTSSLSGWISEYSITATVRCGWLGGVALS